MTQDSRKKLKKKKRPVKPSHKDQQAIDRLERLARSIELENEMLRRR